MKRVVCLMVMIILTLVPCSCVNGGVTMFFGDNDNRLADARMEELFDAVKRQNKGAIKELFSEKAIDEAGDVDSKIDHLLSFVQGKLVSWDRDGSSMVLDTVKYGNKKKQLITWYTLYTDEQNYLVFLVDYPIDKIDSKNVGLYSIRILRAENENKLEGTVEEWVIPGIYILDN